MVGWATGGIWTPDPRITNALLYQLSYGGKHAKIRLGRPLLARGFSLVAGFQLDTHRFRAL